MSEELAAALPEVAREIEEFVAAGGWDQPVQLFALVPTAALLAAEPAMAGQLDAAVPLTPIAQEPLAEPELDVALAGIAWPDEVSGCAVVQEIVVLPPSAEAELTANEGAGDNAAESTRDSAVLARLAAAHPARREARMVAAVLRDGPGACVLRLRGDEDVLEEVVEHPDLAPNLLDALRQTFAP
ncbi:MAG TPA: PPA1309 family protein [Pseudonocardiaceae bacterium]